MEAPKVVAPKVEAPKPAASKVEAPKPAAPVKSTPPKVEAPKVEAPQQQAPQVRRGLEVPAGNWDTYTEGSMGCANSYAAKQPQLLCPKHQTQGWL